MTSMLTCSRRDTRQSNRVLANAIAGNDAEWWASAGKVRLAAAEHEWAEVEKILVDQTELDEAACQRRPRDVDIAFNVLLEARVRAGFIDAPVNDDAQSPASAM